MNDAEFDRALGAWEDSQLNAHLAKGEEWDFAYRQRDNEDEAHGAVWDMNLSELYEMAPPTIVREMEAVAEAMTAHVAELMLEGKWEND